MSSSSRPAPHKKRGKTPPKRDAVRPAKAKKLSEKAQIDALERAAMAFEPPAGLKAFGELPLSDATKAGLKKSHFVDMTPIQRLSLPVSLKGKDVLGAARTGSGKTLAFLVPLLEILHRRKWGPQDGLGALVVSPTRELAVQIFEVLRKIGGAHAFSAGLVIGGKSVKEEKERLGRMNILVATPGRLLQHMDQTVGFECDNLQLLVLDEADRILDLGFARTLSALLTHLPTTRQTLLFSATQTQSVAALARLSLTDPAFVTADADPSPSASISAEGADAAQQPALAIPAGLEQHYALVPLDKKMDVLWSFIRSHTQSKTLVFLSSAKQVRFAFEAFRRLQPGVPLLHLYGKQKQLARLQTFGRFSKMRHAVLLATDVAARGLDFAGVDWVVQGDAPEDAETYVHRVGRTARYQAQGRALLLLCPSEEAGMLAALEKRGVKVEQTKIKASKTQSIENQLQNLAFQDPALKHLAQRAFVSYMRSVHLQKDKAIFDVSVLPAAEFAAALGLPGAPKIRFLSREQARARKNASRDVAALQKEDDEGGSGEDDEDEDDDEGADGADGVESGAESDEEEGGEEVEEKAAVPNTGSRQAGVKTKYDRMFGRKNQGILSEHYNKLVDHSDADSDDDFITLKRADHALPDDPSLPPLDPADPADIPAGAFEDTENLSKRKQRMAKSKKAMLKFKGAPTRLLFDDAGAAHEVYEMRDVDEVLPGAAAARAEAARHAEAERARLRAVDQADKEEARDKRREKKRKRKEREREEEEERRGGGPTVTLGGGEDDGYASPVFDFIPEASDEEADARATFDMPPPKRRKGGDGGRGGGGEAGFGGGAEEDDLEALALQRLRRR